MDSLNKLKKLTGLPDDLRRIAKEQRSFYHRISRRISKLEELTAKRKLTDDDRFYEIASDVVGHGKTLLGYDRLYILWQAARNVAPLELPCVEIGSYQGGSARFLASAMQSFGWEDPVLHVIDTFEGHPSKVLTGHDPDQRAGKFSDTSFVRVKKYLSDFRHVEVHQGEASSVINQLQPSSYGLIHIDVDLFEPTLECLRYFMPKLESGGVVVIDDYGGERCAGVADAFEAYLNEADRPNFSYWHPGTEQLVLIKTS